MKKKFLTGLLTMSMTLSLVTGCGNEKPAEVVPSQIGEAVTTESSPAESQTASESSQETVEQTTEESSEEKTTEESSEEVVESSQPESSEEVIPEPEDGSFDYKQFFMEYIPSDVNTNVYYERYNANGDVIMKDFIQYGENSSGVDMTNGTGDRGLGFYHVENILYVYTMENGVYDWKCGDVTEVFSIEDMKRGVIPIDTFLYFGPDDISEVTVAGQEEVDGILCDVVLVQTCEDKGYTVTCYMDPQERELVKVFCPQDKGDTYVIFKKSSGLILPEDASNAQEESLEEIYMDFMNIMNNTPDILGVE